MTALRRARLRDRIRLTLAAVFYYSGLVRAALWWKRRAGDYVVILNYHRAGGHLANHMRHLRRHYRVVELEAALRELYAPASRQQRRHSRPALVLTFDDGYLDNYTHAVRFAREFHVPFSVFPVPAYVESGRCFWWLAPAYLARHTSAVGVVLDGREYDLSNAAEREAFVDDLNRDLLEAASLAAREELLERAERATGVSLPSRRGDATDDAALPATWTELAEMRRSGFVSFGAHTVNHPVLARLDSDEELLREVRDARPLLEAKLEQPITAFAYPIGKMDDIGDRGLRAVRDAGYAWGLSTIEGVNTAQTDRYLLRRLPGDIRVHWLVLEAELAGLLGVVSRLRRWVGRRA